MGLRLRKLIFIASLICLALVPVPVFVDLNDWGFIMQKISFPEAVAPVPIGLFSMACALFLYFIGSLIYPESYKRFVGFSVTCIGGVVFVCLMCWSLFLSEANLLRAVQVYMPLLLLTSISYPVQLFEQRFVFWVVLSSISIFTSLHLISIFLSAADWSAATPYEFALFYEYGIYQSLVTYTAVISLYLVMAFGAALRQKAKFLIRISLVLIALVMLVVLALGARRASLVEVSIVLILAAFFAVFYFLIRAKLSVGVVIVSVAMLPLMFFIDFIGSLPIVVRSVSSYASGNFDSGRFEIYERAVRELSSDFVLLFGGYGKSSGYHNFALDLVYTIGLAPLGIFFITTTYIFVKGIKNMRQGKGKSSWVDVFLFLSIMSCLAVQSMVNASLTQPYYLVNLLMVMLMLYFMPRRVSFG